MTDEFTFEESPWELMLGTVPTGGTVSARRLLSQLESEEQYAQAFDAMLERHITLDTAGLPAPQVGAEMLLRLEREKALAEQGTLLTSLAPEDALRIYLEELGAGVSGPAEEMLPLVVKTAEGFAGRGVLLADLIQEGSLGLWQAMEKGETDLQWWISQYMAGALTLAAFAGGVGEKLRSEMQAYDRADRHLLDTLGRNPTVEEIGAEMGISPQEAELLREALENARLLAPKKQDSPEEQAQSPENTAVYQQNQRIRELLELLPAQEAKLIRLRFGLDGQMPLSPEETGKLLGMTPEQVISAEAEALKKLRG